MCLKASLKKAVTPLIVTAFCAFALAASSTAAAENRFKAGSADQALPSAATGKLSERLFGLPGLSKVGRVAPGILRGGQPEKAGYAALRKMGVRTIINLRSSLSEREEVEKAGMKSIEVPMNAAFGVKREIVDNLIEEMMNPANHPVFIHCRHGKDRTGAVVAIYRIRIQGWSLEEAEAEMLSFGFNKMFFTLRKQVREYSAAPD